MTRPCPICPYGRPFIDHADLCTPALRSLVRAAKYESLCHEDRGLGFCGCKLCRAVARYEKKRTPPAGKGRR